MLKIKSRSELNLFKIKMFWYYPLYANISGTHGIQIAESEEYIRLFPSLAQLISSELK